VLSRDATRLGANPYQPFTLIFLDPPYGSALGATALTQAWEGGWIDPKALVIWEESTQQFAPSGCPLI